MTRQEIEPQFPELLANTLPTRPIIGLFQYNGIFYKQKLDLPLSSPVRGVLVFLFLGFLV